MLTLSRAPLWLLLALIFASILTFDAEAQTPRRGRGRRAPRIEYPPLHLDGEGGAPAEGGRDGNGHPDRRRVTLPFLWEVGAGYSGSMVTMPDADATLRYNHGAELRARLVFDSGRFAVNLRAHMAFGEEGLQYLYINGRTFRWRAPFGSTESVWIAFAPLDFDAFSSSRRGVSPRFGWHPSVMIGTILPLGGGSGPGLDDPRRRGTAHGACVLHLFVSGGAAVGAQETLDSDIGHGFTGAEAAVYCDSIVVDFTQAMIWSARDAHAFRSDLDIFGRIHTGEFEWGPYANARVGYEMGWSGAGDDVSSRRADRTTVDVTSGFRLMWWGP